jgi:hypothetical protein
VEDGQKTVSVPDFSPECSTIRTSSRVISWISVLPLVLSEMLAVLTVMDILLI